MTDNKLDPETERIVLGFVRIAQSGGELGEAGRLQIALRNRIRELQEEARKDEQAKVSTMLIQLAMSED